MGVELPCVAECLARERPRMGSGSQTKSPILHGRLVSYSSINPVISKSNICLAAAAIDRLVFPPVLVREIRWLLTHRGAREREMERAGRSRCPIGPFYKVLEVTSGVGSIRNYSTFSSQGRSKTVPLGSSPRCCNGIFAESWATVVVIVVAAVIQSPSNRRSASCIEISYRQQEIPFEKRW